MDVQGRTFMITGGASGLGAGTAKRLVELGGQVILADLNAEAGTAYAKELGENAHFVKVDVTDTDSITQAIAVAKDRFSGLHGVVNCAGILIAEKTLGRRGVHSLDGFERLIQVNLIGTFNVIRLVAESLSQNEPTAEGERGVIVNTASVAAYDGQMGQAAYAASKGAIVSLTLPVARDLAQYGIRIMAIAPGIFNTSMLAGLPEQVRQSLGEQIPFPSRLGEPSEYAALVAHIIQNVMLNGEVIRLDGALRMAAR